MIDQLTDVAEAAAAVSQPAFMDDLVAKQCRLTAKI